MTATTFDREHLLCTEVLDVTDLTRTPERDPATTATAGQPAIQPYPELPPTVKALEDTCQVRDHRILQNLLRNEDKYIPPLANFLETAQQGIVTPHMRKIVAEWMLEVILEENSQPDVFCLAMNILDRFLCRCQISKSQLQLLGSVCILIGSKIREPVPITGQKLIIYTDCSITPEELKEWELLVLHKLQWELTAITSLDFLDHTIPRLGLDDLSSADLFELRRRTETILVLCATDYQFSYHSPSLLAASALLTSIECLATYTSANMRGIRLRLQTVTHTPTGHLDCCKADIRSILPSYLLTGAGSEQSFTSQPSPDSTMTAAPTTATPSRSITPSSPEPDLACSEILSNTLLQEDDRSVAAVSGGQSSNSRSSSPLSAVDIFTEFNTNILQPFVEHAENTVNEAGYSRILVS